MTLGYIKTPSALRIILKIRDKLRELNPNLIHGMTLARAHTHTRAHTSTSVKCLLLVY